MQLSNSRVVITHFFTVKSVGITHIFVAKSVYVLHFFTVKYVKKCYNPVFDSYTYKSPSKTLIYSALFEGLFA